MRKVSRADETYDVSFRTAAVENVAHIAETVRTAEAWPSKIDHAHHIKEMNTLLDHHAKGEEWHADRGEMEKSRLHATAADALRDAIFACSEAAEGRHLDNAWDAKHSSYHQEWQPIHEAIEATGHVGVPGEGIHPDYEGVDICMKCPGHTTWPCKVINDHLNRR